MFVGVRGSPGTVRAHPPSVGRVCGALRAGDRPGMVYDCSNSCNNSGDALCRVLLYETGWCVSGSGSVVTLQHSAGFTVSRHGMRRMEITAGCSVVRVRWSEVS